jgi:hypothetical protein
MCNAHALSPVKAISARYAYPVGISLTGNADPPRYTTLFYMGQQQTLLGGLLCVHIYIDCMRHVAIRALKS